MQESGSGSAMLSSTSSGASGEVVYGTERGSNFGTEESRVMSEKVQQLASSIYKEFEVMIQKCGENAVKDLMPLVVNVLESLDLSYLEKEEHEVEVELLKEDNEQLVTQYEREKQLRRTADQKYLEVEDQVEAEQKVFHDKIESLESIVRMLELKTKNSTDHSNRLEERETELKGEYQKLHDRYTDLFKTHMDYMERTQFLMGSDKFDMIQSGSTQSSDMRMKGMFSSAEGVQGRREVSDIMQHSTRSLPLTAEQNLSADLQADWSDELSPSTAADILAASPDDSKDSAERQTSSDNESHPQRQSESEETMGADFTGGLVDPAEYASADSDNSSEEQSREDDSGMGREVENLIKENTELLETKNALNVVKNDLIAQVDELGSEQSLLRGEVHCLEMVRMKLNERVKELEEELKQTKEKLEEAVSAKEEDDVPMAQRKRFTRVEMARVLMERNQYKEKLMELQEAVRWTELMRAARVDSKGAAKKKGGIWDFFSSLFTGTEVSPRKERSKVRSSASTDFGKQGGSGTDPILRKKAGSEKRKALDFLDPEYSSERRAAERREQYKLVKAHVKKDESGRLHAYGWSIPAADNKQPTVPVPIYCRPLFDLSTHKSNSMKIWCATGILLSGGRTKDGGFVVGGSVFYSKPVKPDPSIPAAERTEEQKELRELDLQEWEYSSLIWVCSSAHGQSQVSVIDANNPSEVLETFPVFSSHLLCASSVPGVQECDYLSKGDLSSLCGEGNKEEGETGERGKVVWVDLSSLGDGITYSVPEEHPSPKKEDSVSVPESKTDSAAGSKRKDLPAHIKDGLSKYEGFQELTTALPTVWMGSQNQYIRIHSAVAEWKKCLKRVKMPDAVLSIVHYKGRIFAALANGKMAVFHRQENGEWSMRGFHLITIGRPQSSVRCVTLVAGRIWCAYRNSILVFNSESLKLEKTFPAHPRKESQVRQLVWVGDGVWCSIRLDSTLRLYHAHTMQHMQDVDIEPYVSKMLGTSKLGFSFIRITALMVSCRRLWIGTGNGVILSVPLSETNEMKVETGGDVKEGGGLKGPGGLVRVYSDPAGGDRIHPGTFIPYCNMTRAQLSFHGHKDAVKFFVGVPGCGGKSERSIEATPSSSNSDSTKTEGTGNMVVVSGGDGYIDFRIGEEEEEGKEGSVSQKDLSHLIVWEVPV